MKKSQIKNIKAREILDSRGKPTVESDLITAQGLFRASVPSGASKGKYEAIELKDREKRYFKEGVKKAVKNINQIIAPRLKGKDVAKQKEIDEFMIKLDGTKNKAKLGANAILPVSIAVCRAAAAAQSLPLYSYVSQLSELAEVRPPLIFVPRMPEACFNVINGGAHAGNDLDIQEFMIVPQMKSFKENLRIASEIYHTLKEILEKKFGKSATNLGDEGGFAPCLRKAKDVLDLIVIAIKKANYQKKVKIGLDCAASQFYKNGKYFFEGKRISGEKLGEFYQNLIKNYPILFLEDPFSENDLKSWQHLISNIQYPTSNIFIIGDDLTVTNPERIKEAQKKKACNGVILKPNQIGTVTETIEAVKLAKFYNWKIIVSHRSGDTCDDFISDLAVGIGADFIKSGAPARGERVSKYNRLLRIEEEIKANQSLPKKK